MPIRVIVVDDHPVVQQGLRAVLDASPDFELVATEGDTPSALMRLHSTSVDVVVVDLSLPGDGFLLIRTARAAFPDVRVVVYSMHPRTEFGHRARSEGAHAYVQKSESVDDLLRALRGESDEPHSDFPVTPLDALSAREMQIYQLLVDGGSPSDVANALDLAASTVSTHIRHIKDKLRVQTVTELVRYAMANRSSSLPVSVAEVLVPDRR